MAERLTKYIRAAMRKEFEWGVHDCILFCADWVLASKGQDPARRWRGTYHSEDEAKAIIDEFGGLVRLCDAGYRGILNRCPPEDALIGVIVSSEGDTGAVRSGVSWVVLTESGIGRMRADLVKCLTSWS